MKASQEKERHGKLPEEKRNKISERKREVHKAKQESISSDPDLKKQATDKNRKNKAKSREYVQNRNRLIALYSYDAPRFPSNLRAVNSTYCFGKGSRSSKLEIPRIPKINKAHGLIDGNLGKEEREGVNCRLTNNSLTEI